MPANALEALARLPVHAVKGVGDDWSETLSARRLTTLGDLAKADPEQVAALVADTRSRQPIQIVTVVGLLDRALPENGIADALEVTLYALVGLSPTDIRALAREAGQPVTQAQATEVSRLVSVAYTALNVRWLQRMTLRDLVAGTVRET